MKALRAIALIILVALIATALVSPPAAAAEDFVNLGRWSEPFWEGGAEAYDPPSLEKSQKYPVPAALMALPDGRVVYWNGLEGIEKGTVWVLGSDGKTILENARVRLLDLLTPAPTWTTSEKERGTTDEATHDQHGPAHDLFCSDQKLLYDGTVLIAGGAHWDMRSDASPLTDWEVRGLKDGRVFDPSRDKFRHVGSMQEPRWYPSLVTLADGRVIAASGVRGLGRSSGEASLSSGQVTLTEIYDPATEEWADGGEGEWSFPLYPRLHLLPDGKVFYGGAGQAWNPMGQTTDQAMWGARRLYDPEAGEWTTLGRSRYDMRSAAASVLLRLEPPYNSADILTAGGTSGSSPSSFVASTLSEVVRWTAPGGIEEVGGLKSPFAGLTGDESQLRNRRWNGVPIMLPTGEVFLASGGDTDDVVDPGSAAPVRTPELYDPETGTWRELAPAQRDRTYHHSAVLLPDGRVLVGGHAPHPAHYFQHGATPTRHNDFKDATFEIYEPPYLFRGPRPVVSAVHPTTGGREIRLILGGNTKAEEISEVVLVRLGASTHSMDGDMRAVRLVHTGRGATVSAQLPNGGAGRILPPGPYYVFAMRDTEDGPVPSVAKVILVQPSGEGKVVARSI